MAGLLRRFWHHIADRPEASLSEIQERLRAEAGYRLLPPSWEPCGACGTLISGAHRCPVAYRDRTPEVVALRLLLLALEIQQRESRKSKKVLSIARKRATA